MPTGQRKFAREDGKYADFLDTNSGNLQPAGTAFIGSSNLAAPSDHIHPGPSSGANPIGSQVAYAKITSTVTQVLGAGTWTAVAGSPSITLPNDGNTYRIDLTGPAAQISTAANVRIAIGTSTSALLAESYQNYGGGATNYYTTNIVAQKVTGSGQTVSVYAECSAAYTLTLNVDSCLFELAAYRVA